MIKIRKMKIQLIQIGERTHHHDQVIYPVNFKVMKTIVNRPIKLMPPPEVEEELLFAISSTFHSRIVHTLDRE
jgi:hypothetical protein